MYNMYVISWRLVCHLYVFMITAIDPSTAEPHYATNGIILKTLVMLVYDTKHSTFVI